MLVTKKKKKRMRNGSKKRDRRKKLVFHLKKVKTHFFFLFCVCFVGAVVAAQPVYLRRLLFCAFYDFFNRNNNS